MKKILIGATIGFVSIWTLSHVVETLRATPESPATLSWDQGINVKWVETDNGTLRYIKTGEGPNLVLLHTFSTQLGQFQKVIPTLKKHYTVYAYDHPGFGYSTKTVDTHDAQMYADTAEDFLESLNIQDATVAGESIGGSVALMLAASGNERVKDVLAINPTGYAKRSLGRGSRISSVFTRVAKVPVIGGMVSRMRNPKVIKGILAGGVTDINNFPDAYLSSLVKISSGKGFGTTQLKFFDHTQSWIDATDTYRNIKIPAHILWGEKDWSYTAERDDYIAKVAGGDMTIVPGGGHFITIDKPEAILDRLLPAVD